jgi:hypothetical protein
MGTERTSTNFRRYFYNVDNAKRYAEDDYEQKRPGEKFAWKQEENGRIRSPDLGFVMYHVIPITMEDAL